KKPLVLGAAEEVIDLEERRRRDHPEHLRTKRSTAVGGTPSVSDGSNWYVRGRDGAGGRWRRLPRRPPGRGPAGGRTARPRCRPETGVRVVPASHCCRDRGRGSAYARRLCASR